MAKHAKYVIYDPGDKIDVASEGDIPGPRDLVEQMYCSEQIHIPPTFPYILRQYCKAAIRTQPYDLLKWSTAYFRAMAEGDIPPVKQRLEYPPTDVPSGLTPGYLRVILRQLKRKKVVPTELLYTKWGGLCLNHNALKGMLEIGEFTDDEVDVLKFVAIAAGHLSDSLKRTMIIICEILTEEPEGGSAMIPFSTFCDLYTFLAKKDCGPPSALAPDIEEPQEEEELDERRKDKTEDELEEQPSAVLHAEGIIYEIVDNVTNASQDEDQIKEGSQGESDQEPSPESSKDLLEDTLEDSEEHEQPPTAEVHEDEDQATETNEENGQATETNEENGQATETNEENGQATETNEETGQVTETNGETGQVTETNGETGMDNMHADEQHSMEAFDRTTSVKFKEAVDIETVTTEEQLSKDVPALSGSSSSASVTEGNSAEKIAKETVKEIVRRAQVAAGASKAEITAAQFLIKVRSETQQSRKLRLLQRKPKKKPKPRPTHYEVPGIGSPVSEEQIDKVITYLHYWSARQEGMIMPRNINHFLCPSLDPPPPPEFVQATQSTCSCGIGDPMASECHCIIPSGE